MHPAIQHLLGCGWGRVVGVRGYDNSPCDEPAIQIAVLHDGKSLTEVRLCGKHLDIIDIETTDHDPEMDR